MNFDERVAIFVRMIDILMVSAHSDNYSVINYYYDYVFPRYVVFTSCISTPVRSAPGGKKAQYLAKWKNTHPG